MFKNSMKGWLGAMIGAINSAPKNNILLGSRGADSLGCPSRVNNGFKRNKRRQSKK